MAKIDEESKPEWIERVKSEGAVPFLDLNNCPNGWASPPGDNFKVRGPQYFSTKFKIPGGQFLLKPLGFDWLKGPTKVSDFLNNPQHRIRKALDDEFPTGDKPFIWAFNLQVPSKENYSAVAYYVSMGAPEEGSLMGQFLKGDDGFRNSRLKLIANIVKGPWIVKKAVGEQAICVIGRALTCKYTVCQSFMEVDIDIGSSVVASAVVHLALGYIAMLTVDIAFLIEGQTESELPERILGAVRFSELKIASAMTVEPPCDAVPRQLQSQSSRAKRLWMSLSHRFSNLLHPVPQENGSVSGSGSGQGLGSGSGSGSGAGAGSGPGSPHANGVVDHEESVKDGKRW